MMKIQYPPEGDSELMGEALKCLERLVVTCTTTGGEQFTATIDEVFTDEDGWLCVRVQGLAGHAERRRRARDRRHRLRPHDRHRTDGGGVKHHEYEKVRAGAIVRTNCTDPQPQHRDPRRGRDGGDEQAQRVESAAPRCECCGIRPFIMRVPAREVDLVRHANQPTSEEG